VLGDVTTIDALIVDELIVVKEGADVTIESDSEVECFRWKTTTFKFLSGHIFTGRTNWYQAVESESCLKDISYISNICSETDIDRIFV